MDRRLIAGQVVDVIARAGGCGPGVPPDGAGAELAGGAGAAEERGGGVRAALTRLLPDVVVLPVRPGDTTSTLCSGQPNVISASAEYSAETISVFYICFGVSAETLFSAEIASFGRNSQFWPK